jgi:hypothetical protein
MTYDVMRNNGFKTVQYNWNANKPSNISANNFDNHIRIPLNPIIKNTEILKKDVPESKSSDKATDKATDNANSTVEKKSIQNINTTQNIKPDMSEMPEISFVPQAWSRDLILFENNKPAVSKTYHFNYKGKNFPGIITDSIGKIYIYDRANDFHRPLKHLQRIGDIYSGYHAGFQEVQGKKNTGHYIDLGTLEVLQAALKSSVGGKYNVAIHDDDSFMTNWMRATSENETEKLRYWNDNVSKLDSKTRKNLNWLLYAGIAGGIIIPSTLLTISLINNGDITPQDNEKNPISNTGEKALIGILPAVGAAGLGIIGTHMYQNKKQKLYSNENENFKSLDSEYTDTLLTK